MINFDSNVLRGCFTHLQNKFSNPAFSHEEVPQIGTDHLLYYGGNRLDWDTWEEGEFVHDVVNDCLRDLNAHNNKIQIYNVKFGEYYKHRQYVVMHRSGDSYIFENRKNISFPVTNDKLQILYLLGRLEVVHTYKDAEELTVKYFL